MSDQPFDMSEFNLDLSDDDLATADKESQRKVAPLKPGTYDLKISALKTLGREKNDPNWVKVQVSMIDPEDRKATAFVKVPTVSAVYVKSDGTTSMKVLGMFKSFVEAVGGKGDKEAIKKTAKNLLQGSDALLGKTVKNVVLGYNSDHAEYISKDCYQVVDRDNKKIAAGPDTFSSFEEANNWYQVYTQNPNAKLQGLQVLRFEGK